VKHKRINFLYFSLAYIYCLSDTFIRCHTLGWQCGWGSYISIYIDHHQAPTDTYIVFRSSNTKGACSYELSRSRSKGLGGAVRYLSTDDDVDDSDDAVDVGDLSARAGSNRNDGAAVVVVGTTEAVEGGGID